MTNELDEFGPGERGLLIGTEWAKAAIRSNHSADAVEIALEGEVPEEVRRGVLASALRERLVDADAEDAFWRGFVFGVRAFVTEVERGPTPN